MIAADRTPIEEAAAMLNTRHRTDDMHARRQEAILAGRSLLNVEQMARAIDPRAFSDDLGDEHFATRRNVATLAAQRIRAAQLGEHA